MLVNSSISIISTEIYQNGKLELNIPLNLTFLLTSFVFFLHYCSSQSLKSFPYRWCTCVALMCVTPTQVRRRQLSHVNLWLSQLAETPVCRVVPYTSLLNHKLHWNTFNNYQRNVKCLFHLIFFHMNAPPSLSLSPTLACFLFAAVSFVQQLVLWHLIADLVHFLRWERSQITDVASKSSTFSANRRNTGVW